jgi:hypothetical protein
MPKLDGKSYKYDTKGMKAYIKALRKKRKKSKKDIYDGVNGVDSNPANTGA